jgi:uncharacterized membrane protein
MSQPPAPPKHPPTSRLEAFSDGVIAIIVTLLIFEVRVFYKVRCQRMPNE